MTMRTSFGKPDVSKQLSFGSKGESANTLMVVDCLVIASFGASPKLLIVVIVGVVRTIINVFSQIIMVGK